MVQDRFSPVKKIDTSSLCVSFWLKKQQLEEEFQQSLFTSWRCNEIYLMQHYFTFYLWNDFECTVTCMRVNGVYISACRSLVSALWLQWAGKITTQYHKQHSLSLILVNWIICRRNCPGFSLWCPPAVLPFCDLRKQTVNATVAAS